MCMSGETLAGDIHALTYPLMHLHRFTRGNDQQALQRSNRGDRPQQLPAWQRRLFGLWVLDERPAHSFSGM